MIPTMEYAIVVSDDDTFTQYEAPEVVEKFVCGVCHGNLSVVYIPNDHRTLVICPEHGNVTQCGRVTTATVSIQTEKEFASFQTVIRNLPDLWGELTKAGVPREKAYMLTSTHVCEICGGRLDMWSRADSPRMEIVDVGCTQHANLRTYKVSPGYVEKSKYVYNFQKIKSWEKENKKEKK